MADRYAQRARELMLTPESAARYVVIAAFGTCPDCDQRMPDNYETTTVRHAQTCKGKPAADAIDQVVR